ncbi:MAG: cupin domain-containing protein [Rubrivivax sp.]
MAGAEFASFENLARRAGFDEVLERQWEANRVLETHAHPFAVTARVVQGEMWLTVDGHARHLHAGDTFELAADVPHAERYGPDGATFWVARRHRDTRPASPATPGR